MRNYLPQGLVLALAYSGLSCSDTATQPDETQDSGAPPSLAISSGTWVRRANLPGDRWALSTATVTNAAGESILYAIGGRSETGGAISNVNAYNTATNDWLIRAPLPTPLHTTNGIGVIGGKLYVSGGAEHRFSRYRGYLYVYDPAQNTWTRKSDMPNTSYGGVTAVLNGQLYVLTACDQEDCSPSDAFGARFYRYDPASDQWTTLPSPVNNHQFGVSGRIGGKLYVAGPDTELDMYDPATGEWTSLAPMPEDRAWAAGTALGAKLYVINGVKNNHPHGGLAVRSTLIYDPKTDTWTTGVPMPDDRYDISASLVRVNGKARIEVVGGDRPGNNVAYIP